MWIFWNTVSIIFIGAAQFVNRHYGMSWQAYVIYSCICLFVTGWSLPLGYQLAPSLLHAWFLGIALLSIIGFLGSYFIFHDPVSIHHYVGAIIVLIGSTVLIIP